MKPAKPISEREFQAQVVQYARLCGWLVAHFRPALTRSGRWVTPVAADGKGFPDLVLVRETVLFVELKVPPNRLSPDQAAWVERLRGAGQAACVWTPDQWGEIELTLR